MTVLAGRSSKERLWMLAGGLGAFVLLLIGYFFFIGPQRSNTADVNAQADVVRTDNAGLQNRIAGLREQSTKMGWYKEQLTAAEQALPGTSGVPAFLRTLQQLGTSTHTDAVNVTVGAPTDVSTAAAAVPATAPAATSTPSAEAGGNGSIPTTPSGSVYGLSISAQVTGSNAALNAFLQQLQEVQPRAVLITQITEGTGATASGTSASGNSLQLTMQAFVAPSSAGEVAALSSAAGS